MQAKAVLSYQTLKLFWKIINCCVKLKDSYTVCIFMCLVSFSQALLKKQFCRNKNSKEYKWFLVRYKYWLYPVKWKNLPPSWFMNSKKLSIIFCLFLVLWSIKFSAIYISESFLSCKYSVRECTFIFQLSDKHVGSVLVTSTTSALAPKEVPL